MHTDVDYVSDRLARRGFYRTKIDDHSIEATRFQAAGASLAFPCFDQPDMKGNLI